MVNRQQESCRRVRSILKTEGILSLTADGILTAQFKSKPAPELRAILKAIDSAIDAYGRDRLAGRHVEAILRIAPRERRKWTKNGRLPRSGSVSFTRGNKKIYLPVYRADKIALLAADPSAIDAWRQADRGSEVL
jgi:hypothetical protein